MIPAGASYPNFQVVAQDGSHLSIDDLLGGWFLLYWYPRADTPGCTAQAEGLRDQFDSFVELDCTVVGASFDTPEINRGFRERYGLPFELVTDQTRELALAVGASDPASSSAPERVAHLVRPDGVVAVAYRVTDPGFFAESVLDDLELLVEKRG